MLTQRLLVLVAIGPALCGCTKTMKDLELVGYGVAAAPLEQGPDGPGKDPVWKMVLSSERKCTAFVNGLVATETGTHTSLDILTTVASGLATAFTPVATSHALSAAATITSGARTAIDSDVFAKASIANFAQAIQSTYFTDIGDYGTKLMAKSDADVHFYAELAQIETIHAECALGAAESSISSTLQGSDDSGTPAPKKQPDEHEMLNLPTSNPANSFVTPGHGIHHRQSR